MKIIIACVVFMATAFTSFSQSNLKLWYNKPATTWTEALPIGNGRLGAMIFGNVEEELIQLNEATLWSGGPVKTNVNPASPQYLQPLREALFKSDYKKADAMAHKMQGLYSESYMPLGDLLLKQSFTNKAVTNYYRDLNIEDGIATTTYTIDNINYKREIFASAPDNIMLIKLSANKQKKINITIIAKSILKYQLSNNSNVLLLKGKAPTHVEPSYYNPKREAVVYDDTTGCRGMRFELQIKAVHKDGELLTDSAGIHISTASEIVLYVSAATSFNGYNKCPDKEGKDQHQLATAYLNKAVTKNLLVLIAHGGN